MRSQHAIIVLLSASLWTTPLFASGDKAKSPRPTGHPEKWVTVNDYPLEAYKEGKAGIVGFRLQVDADGHPTNCEVVATSQDGRLDQQTCNLLLARAKFKPALDRNKNPVEGVFQSEIHWVIPPY